MVTNSVSYSRFQTNLNIFIWFSAPIHTGIDAALTKKQTKKLKIIESHQVVLDLGVR